ncbi:PstS family phosphate ABC transporter substrate-binding protein [Edaphobacter bradus]|uniref:PstS family phosphate ABC transporter substrate-binding protein n=1 Tax=Edaphobacter bradus TaxID=2259016 RepID=UPI0021DFAE3B|nr:substrate-binding domain-containing protein [Edaphobacter bradus]
MNSIRTQAVQNRKDLARASHSSRTSGRSPAARLCRLLALIGLVSLMARRPALAQQYDLSGLPPYHDETNPQQLHGVIRIHGTELTQHLIHEWEDAFLKLHPLVRFGDYMLPTGFSGLCAGTADINVMGHTAWRSDLKAFEETFGYDPFEVMFATGGFNLRKGNTPAAIIFVNKDNPIGQLSLRQLDGIFGAQRTGGWNGTHWSTASARGPEGDIRTWGQLGLTGDWKDKPIHLYGIDATLSNWSELIQRVVFKGGDKWNPAMNEIVRGGVEIPADAQIVSSVANDPGGIGFNLMRVVEKNPGVKALAIGAQDQGPYIQPTAESCYQRTYPLVNSVYLYLNRPPGKPFDPRLKEFLKFVLSREGQQIVVDDGMFIPLNPEAAHETLRKLD